MIVNIGKKSWIIPLRNNIAANEEEAIRRSRYNNLLPRLKMPNENNIGNFKETVQHA
jgi:hypothetical protein